MTGNQLFNNGAQETPTEQKKKTNRKTQGHVKGQRDEVITEEHLKTGGVKRQRVSRWNKEEEGKSEVERRKRRDGGPMLTIISHQAIECLNQQNCRFLWELAESHTQPSGCCRGKLNVFKDKLPSFIIPKEKKRKKKVEQDRIKVGVIN